MENFIEINRAFPWFFPACVFVFGAIVGSFLNVCIYRIPAEKSIISPGSTCACGKPVRWFDNIPILSWLILRGRARCCGRPFSVRYPAIELLTAVLFLLAWRHYPPVQACVGMIFISVLICATFIDLDHMIIPDRFTIGAAVVGVILAFLVPVVTAFFAPANDPLVPGDYAVQAVRALIESSTGVLIGSGVVLWIALIAEIILKKEAMGFGDVKFLGAIGAFVGWRGAIFSIFGGAMIGTAVFGVIMLGHAVFRKKEKIAGSTGAAPPPSDSLPTGEKDKDKSEDESPIGFGRETPFGPMLAAGALIYFLFARGFVDGYFESIVDVLYR